MSIAPRTVQDFLMFCKSHTGPWSAAPTTIGLSAEKAVSFQEAYDTAQASYDAAVALDAQKRAATLTSQSDIRALRQQASECLALIKAYAENQANPNTVYAAAEIPAPLPPAPAPAPGTPMDFTVALLQTGAVELKWKCANPAGTQGTIYECRRMIGNGAFTFVGATGVRAFTDDTLPSGSAGVTYEITAVRSTKRGLPAQFNVNFGVGGDGMAFASVSAVQPVRMAA